MTKEEYQIVFVYDPDDNLVAVYQGSARPHIPIRQMFYKVEDGTNPEIWEPLPNNAPYLIPYFTGLYVREYYDS